MGDSGGTEAAETESRPLRIKTSCSGGTRFRPRSRLRRGAHAPDVPLAVRPMKPVGRIGAMSVDDLAGGNADLLLDYPW